MTDHEYPQKSSADSTNVLSWQDRYARGQAWHRYWNHPQRWNRRRWIAFFFSILSNFGFAWLLVSFADEVTGWMSPVLWVTASFFGLLGLVGVGVAWRIRVGLRRGDLRWHEDD